MPCGPQMGRGGLVGGEPDGVVDPVLLDLVPPQQPGQDRQPGGVGGGPAVGAELVVLQRPDRAGAGVPAPVAERRRVELVELALVLVDDDRVPVAVGVAAALDLGVPAERVLHVVALGGVVEGHLRLLVLLADHGDRDAVVGAVAVRRPEVGVQVDIGRHVREPGRRPGVHRQLARRRRATSCRPGTPSSGCPRSASPGPGVRRRPERHSRHSRAAGPRRPARGWRDGRRDGRRGKRPSPDSRASGVRQAWLYGTTSWPS